MAELWPMHGGLRLDADKQASTRQPIGKAPIPPRLILPMRQHIGEPCRPLVKPGDRVLRGQLIASGDSALCVRIHAPTSGRVIAVEPRPIAHPSGQADTCIVIDADGLITKRHLGPLSADDLDEAIDDALAP